MPGGPAKEVSNLLSVGWLSQQPEAFQNEVLARGQVQSFAAGDVVYRIGDPPGGIYGLLRGTLAISLAPPHSEPHFFQFGIVGAWAGEGPFLTGHPRRVEMRAISHCDLFHLPLETMERIAALDPRASRYFARITVAHFDVLTRVIDDLLISQPDRRIAAVLHRAGQLQSRSIPISQAELGAMANASRKQVNAALSRFETMGWVTHAYRSIAISNAEALLHFASGADAP